MPLASSTVGNLSAWFDFELTMNTHVKTLCSVAYFHLHNPKAYTEVLVARDMRAASARFSCQSDPLLQQSLTRCAC